MPAFRETQPVPHRGDAADDPALWIHPDDPARSTIIGTDKDGGLAVYDLRGRELQYLHGGRPNNIDLRPGFRLRGRSVTLVAAEERDYDQIVLYRVNPVTRRLHSVAARRIRVSMEVYGSLYRSAASGRFYVFVSSKEGRIRQFRILPRRQRTLVDRTGRRGNLTADVEGLALANLASRGRYLIASNQGRNSYTIYRRGQVDEYLTTFRIAPGPKVDGAQDTDGIDATTRPLGPDFPTGLFVAQDGHNPGGNQNFKLVRWDIAAIVGDGNR